MKATLTFILKLAAGVIALWVIAAFGYAIVSFVSRSSSHWLLQLHDRDGSVAVTLSKSTGSHRRTVVIDGATSASPRRSFRLPDQLKELEGAQLEFSDTSPGPGRVRFRFLGHTFDIMERALIIDGTEHPWNDKQVIPLPTSNHAMERTATRRAFTSCVVIASALRPTLALGGRRSSYSR